MGVFSDLDDYSKEQLCEAALATHKWAKQAVAKMIAPGAQEYDYWVFREGYAKFKREHKLKAPTVIIPRALVPEEMQNINMFEVKQGEFVDDPVPMAYEVGQLRNIARMMAEAAGAVVGARAGEEVAVVRANRAAGRAAIAQPVFPPVEWAVPERAAIAPQVFVAEFNPEDPF